MEKYDSTPDTLAHIGRVKQLGKQFVDEFIDQVRNHDNSKLSPEEKDLFDEYTPKLKHVEYNSHEYKQFLVDLKPALDNHYAKNRHHPEHHQDGIYNMDLFDIVEMLIDWKASGERNKDGNIFKSINIQWDRFGISEQLVSILHNTAKRMWPDVEFPDFSGTDVSVARMRKLTLMKDHAEINQIRKNNGLPVISFEDFLIAKIGDLKILI